MPSHSKPSRSTPSYSVHGGRHELGQNFLAHRPTIDHIVCLALSVEGASDATPSSASSPAAGSAAGSAAPSRVSESPPAASPPAGSILEIGAGDGALTVLRKLLAETSWTTAILLTQWEVARKRAGVGGSTLMTAQFAPWFEFRLDRRVSAEHFRPQPNVDGGLLVISRRQHPLVPRSDRRLYESFVRAVFTARGRGLVQMLASAVGLSSNEAREVLSRAHIPARGLPRDLPPEKWAQLWKAVGRRGATPRGHRRRS